MNNIAEKLQQIAENEEKIYNLNEQLEQTLYGTDTGGKSYYDEFWDGKQAGGGYRDYTSAFGGRWSAEIFKPKYDIEPSYANYMFYANSLNIDLVEHLEKIGRKIDFSKCRGQISCFTASKFTHLGNVSATGGFASVFQNCKELVTIDEWGHAEGGDITDTLTNTFASCAVLENITIKGRIANTIYFHWSTKLTRASIESIVNALSDNVSGKTLQLSKTAVNNAFSTDEWNSLATTKSNWTITLI